jgi:hypothetical protein
MVVISLIVSSNSRSPDFLTDPPMHNSGEKGLNCKSIGERQAKARGGARFLIADWRRVESYGKLLPGGPGKVGTDESLSLTALPVR